jgi:hypothetical protein
MSLTVRYYRYSVVEERTLGWASVRECPLTTTRQINLTIKNDYGKSAD